MKLSIKIYNTLTEKKEVLKKPARGPLKFFVCGPTVYDLPHIGHAKTYIAFDVIVCFLRATGFKIFYLQNITDIDDKIINRARKEKTTPHEIARRFEKLYQEDMNVLGINSVDQYARATDFMTAILKQIKTLLQKGYAYPTASGIYFEVKKFPHYGRLSGQKLDELRPGWRIEPDPEKRDPLDFALWKFSDQEPHWPSPFGSKLKELGNGRPGWHIEDTAITETIFGPQYDLHGGGVDLKFPHHESEIAQAEAASGKKPFVKIWLHTGALLVNGEKMSKSLKNFITIHQFLENHSPLTLRFLITSSHYRSPLNYTEQLVQQAENAVSHVTKFLTMLELIIKRKNSLTKKLFDPKKDCLLAQEKFFKAMADDFNTPEALAAIFSLINLVQEKIWELGPIDARVIKKSVRDCFSILGMDFQAFQAPENIHDLVEKRELFRKEKKFPQADELRKKIQALGYAMDDTPLGPLVSES